MADPDTELGVGVGVLVAVGDDRGLPAGVSAEGWLAMADAAVLLALSDGDANGDADADPTLTG